LTQAQLQTFSPDTESEILSQALVDNGACIVRDVLDAGEINRIRKEIDPWIERSETGRDDFTGRKTKRTGALVARSPACCDLLTHPKILAAANKFLEPYCDRIIVHLTQTIDIFPGQEAQLLHRDRLAWGTYLPKEIEPQFNTIWALTDFTKENGATHVVPGSNHWPLKQNAKRDQTIQAEMSAGSVLLYSGTVIHGGGENRSNAERLGINMTYCLGWLRQEENQYLSCPPEVAKDLPKAVTDLLGYTMGNYALGYYSSPSMVDGLPDTLLPEIAVGKTAGEQPPNTPPPNEVSKQAE